MKVYKNLKQTDEIITDHSAYVNTASLLSQMPRPRAKLTAEECFGVCLAMYVLRITINHMVALRLTIYELKDS